MPALLEPRSCGRRSDPALQAAFAATPAEASDSKQGRLEPDCHADSFLVRSPRNRARFPGGRLRRRHRCSPVHRAPHRTADPQTWLRRFFVAVQRDGIPRLGRGPFPEACEAASKLRAFFDRRLAAARASPIRRHERAAARALCGMYLSLTYIRRQRGLSRDQSRRKWAALAGVALRTERPLESAGRDATPPRSSACFLERRRPPIRQLAARLRPSVRGLRAQDPDERVRLNGLSGENPPLRELPHPSLAAFPERSSSSGFPRTVGRAAAAGFRIGHGGRSASAGLVLAYGIRWRPLFS